jgi:hypothetical protein
MLLVLYLPVAENQVYERTEKHFLCFFANKKLLLPVA